MSEFYSEAEAREIIRQSVVDEKLIEEAAKAIAHSRGDSRAGEQDRISARAALAVFEKAQGEPSDASTCDHCGGEAWHHTVECFTGAKPLQEAISRLENCLSNRDAGIGAWSMVQPEDVRTVLSALRAAGEVQ